MKPPAIAILTDFGTVDPYVGIMKGVIHSIAPGIPLIDLTHHIAPGDIQQGAYFLWQSCRNFPPGTVFLAVVDPGVGTARKALLFQRDQQFFIGPDNGLFSYLEYRAASSAWELANPQFQLKTKSATFHGRDIFAPAAAHAALGAQGPQFGPPVAQIHRLSPPLCRSSGASLEGEVLGRDLFGNLITSLGTFRETAGGLHFDSWIEDSSWTIPSGAALSIEASSQQLPFAHTFGEIGGEGCAGLIGSTGLLEIAANQRSAAQLLGLKRGARVRLKWS